MARYIDLDKVEFLKVKGNEEFNHGVDCCISKLLEIEPVDVIERVEYEKLKQKNIELEIEYDDIMKMNTLRVNEYKQLRSKIDKALEQTYKVRKEVLHSNEIYEPNNVIEIIDEISADFERCIGE